MDMEHILDFPEMATDGGMLRIVVRHVEGVQFDGSGADEARGEPSMGAESDVE